MVRDDPPATVRDLERQTAGTSATATHIIIADYHRGVTIQSRVVKLDDGRDLPRRRPGEPGRTRRDDGAVLSGTVARMANRLRSGPRRVEDRPDRPNPSPWRPPRPRPCSRRPMPPPPNCARRIRWARRATCAAGVRVDQATRTIRPSRRRPSSAARRTRTCTKTGRGTRARIRRSIRSRTARARHGTPGHRRSSNRATIRRHGRDRLNAADLCRTSA